MKAHDTIRHILFGKNTTPAKKTAIAFAPVNIALIKYWGKRNNELNLPVTNSLSIALPNKGTTTTLRINSENHDNYYLNHDLLDQHSEFYQRLNKFCDFFRFEHKFHFDIHTENNIPTAAGLASSASGFAALVLAFNTLFEWHLEKSSLSVLARLGSGSACRSFWNGFVEWEKGERDDGLDSFAQPYFVNEKLLKSFCVGLLILAKEKKIISSREAMRNTVNTSPSYQHWPQQVAQDLTAIKQAMAENNFPAFGKIAERNAIAMHATMLDSHPSTNYCTQQTNEYRKKVWQLRQQGIPVYFTQDAGPNLKLLFPIEIISVIQEIFPEAEITQI